jgi:photosystem II stability/assembly factor-like uncharacterized protein
MKKLYILLFVLFIMKGTMAQWLVLSSGTTEDLNSVFFSDTETGYAVGTSGTILKTVNGGTTWTVLPIGTYHDLASVYFTDSNTGYVVGKYGIIFKTINGGTAWNLMTSGTTENLHIVRFTDVNTGYVVGYNGTILKTTDAGITWNKLSSGTTENLVSVCFTNSNTGYAAGIDHYFKTVDGGTTWTQQYVGTTTLSILSAVYFPETDTGYISGWDFSSGGEWKCVIYKTTDGGAEWTVKLDEWSDSLVQLNSVFFTDVNTGFAVGGEIIIKTNDGGNTWIRQYFLNNYLTSVYFPDTDTGYVAGRDGTILKTTNGGYPVGTLNMSSKPSAVIIYPSPATNIITIETPAKGSLSIRNISGQKLLQQEITALNTTLDVSGLGSGVYVVRFVNGKDVITGKFIKH